MTEATRRRPSPPSLSIRLRLTLLYSAILALALVAFGGVLYVTATNVLLNQAGSIFKAEADNVDRSIDPHSGNVPPLNYVVSAPNTYVQVRDTNGKVVRQSPDLMAAHKTLPLGTSDQQSIMHGNAIPSHVVSVGGTQVLLYSQPIILGFDQPQVVGTVQIAQPVQDIEGPLTALTPFFLLGGAVVIVLAFGLGWLLAGTALRPIARLTEAARVIGEARDFARRVAYKGPRDEVGRLATTFNAMLSGLEESYQSQRRFVADASHELRTPLTSIRGNLGLLQREPPISPTDRRDVLSDLVSESERLSRLVGDLLTLARTDTGRPLRHEPVAVAPLLSDLARRLDASYPGRRIDWEAGNGLAVDSDPDAVMQVLLILLDNALKFTPTTEHVRVTATEAGGRVAIAVRDNGPGIDPQALPHIFERFYQGDAARAGAGTGLGLAIAQAVVEALQGAIAVESVVGHGCTFTVTLPRATPPPHTAVSEPVHISAGTS